MAEASKHINKILVEHKFLSLAITASIIIAIAFYAVANRTGVRNSGNQLGSTVDSHLVNSNSTTGEQGSSALDVNCDTRTDGNRINEDTVAVYQGVSFIYSMKLSSGVKAETRPASALESETDKPDAVAPEHIAFTLTGPYALKHGASAFSPEIHIYPIDDYKKVAAASKSLVKQIEDDVQKLKTIISEQSASGKDRIPFLPWMDATQAFRAHVKYLNFNGGKGVMFLTQYNVEPSLINNQGLTYTFQGLTNDGRYYVSASFPVTASILPKDFNVQSFEDYSLPEYFHNRDYELNQKAYQQYLTETVRKLENLPPHKYAPDLTLFEKMIQSLCLDKMGEKDAQRNN